MKKIILMVALLVCAFSSANAEIIAQFTTKVENKEPVDKITTANKDMDNIVFFSNVLGEKDNTIYHVWKNNGNSIYKRSFDVRGPRWRVWTSVSTHHFQNGDVVSVEVVDEQGTLLDYSQIKIDNVAQAPILESPQIVIVE